MTAPARNRAGRLLLARALEPRFLLDGAALATAVDVAPEPVDTPETQHDADSDQALVDTLAPPAAQADADSAHVDSAPASPKQIVFVDSAVQQYDALVAGLPEGVEVVTLDAGSDGVQQITDALSGRSGITAARCSGSISTCWSRWASWAHWARAQCCPGRRLSRVRPCSRRVPSTRSIRRFRPGSNGRR